VQHEEHAIGHYPLLLLLLLAEDSNPKPVEVGPEGVGGMPYLQHCFSLVDLAIVVVDDFSACIDVVAAAVAAVVVAAVDDDGALAPSGGVAFQYNYAHDKEKVSTTMMGDLMLRQDAETNAELVELLTLLLLRLAEQMLSSIWLFWTCLTLDFQQNLLAFEVFLLLQQKSRNNTFALAGGLAEAFEAGLWLDMTSYERLWMMRLQPYWAE